MKIIQLIIYSLEKKKIINNYVFRIVIISLHKKKKTKTLTRLVEWELVLINIILCEYVYDKERQ